MNRQLIVLAILLGYAGGADAYGSLRCKGRLIDVGDSQARVLALCGAPAKRASQTIPVRAGTAAGNSRFIGITTTEQWVYNRGWGKFPAVLIFNDGRIQQIEYLPYRSGE